MNSQLITQTARALAEHRGRSDPEGLRDAVEDVTEIALIMRGLSGMLPASPAMPFGWRIKPK